MTKRVIKFRALVEYEDLEHKPYRVWEYYSTFSQPIWLESKIIIKDLQFTGLHDKNGKEIYEGDIVEFPPFNKEWCEGEYLPRQRFTVDLSQLRLWLKEEQFGYEGELLLDNNKCKVIGNIYEKGDLLK